MLFHVLHDLSGRSVLYIERRILHAKRACDPCRLFAFERHLDGSIDITGYLFVCGTVLGHTRSLLSDFQGERVVIYKGEIVSVCIVELRYAPHPLLPLLTQKYHSPPCLFHLMIVLACGPPPSPEKVLAISLNGTPSSIIIAALFLISSGQGSVFCPIPARARTR